ncbi:MAG TPA: tetratricopeptide repeat protein [Bryobacteraceae bacterium]|nr:tetratricopeptide repeat protein [Bryobacteraceae bacterium]
MRFTPFAIAVAGVGSLFGQGQSAPASAGAPAEPRAAITLSPEEHGDVYMARKMYRDAIDAYDQGPKDSPVIWNKIGIAWHQLGQLNRARADYEHALKLKPTYAEAQNNVGTVYYGQKSYRRAISAYRKAIALSPQNASFHKNLGTAYFARKQDDLAMAEYQKAIQLDPEVFENRSITGVILEGGTPEDRARLHYSLAKLYAKSDRTELALQYLRKALEEGFRDKKKLEQDPEFQAMRDLPEFKELLALEPRVL